MKVQVILTQVGVNTHLKWNTVHSIHFQTNTGNLHNGHAAVGLQRFFQYLLNNGCFRGGVGRRPVFARNAMSSRPQNCRGDSSRSGH